MNFAMAAAAAAVMSFVVGFVVHAVILAPDYASLKSQPWPIGVVVKQIIFETIGLVLIGIVIAWVSEVGARRAAA